MEHPDHKQNGAGFLGELPRELRQERRELYQDEPPIQPPPGILREIPGAPRYVPAPPPLMPSIRDVRGSGAALRDAQNAPIGLPAVDFLVQTTFDARPINGNDFQWFNLGYLEPVGDPPAVDFSEVSFEVPRGRLAIVRNIKWWPSQILAVPGLGSGGTINYASPFFVTLYVSGAVQTSYERIYQQMGERKTYAIAFEREFITVRYTLNPDWTEGFGQYNPDIYTIISGNLIDSRGREKQYEPANQYINGMLK